MLSYFSSLIIHPSPRAPRVDADSAERATRVGAARAANAETRGQTRERGENAPLGASFNSPGFLPRGTGVSTPGNRGFYPGEQDTPVFAHPPPGCNVLVRQCPGCRMPLDGRVAPLKGCIYPAQFVFPG
jgi:hypothetical protein